MKGIIWAYILAIVVAEAVGVAGNMAIGVAAHGLIIVALLLNYVWAEDAPYRPMLPVLALLPLLRLLSLALPARGIPQIYWYVVVGVPLLLAATLAARLLQITPGAVGLGRRSTRVQAAIALSGLPLAVAAYLILRPAPLFVGFDWPAILIGSVILTLFAGFTEEYIFRGLLLHTTRGIFGRQAAIIGSSLLFAALYVGSLSFGFLLLIGAMGVFFAYCVDKTGSLWGVAVAHSVMAVGMILIMPAIAAAVGLA